MAILEAPRKRRQRAVMLSATFFCLAMFGASWVAAEDQPREQPATAEASRSDFARARAEFRTRLTRREPAPQEYQQQTPPSDARVVRFHSGRIELSAWVGTPRAANGPLPVVIFLHGGFAFGAEDFEMARPFLDAGFMIVTPILRAENGQPGAFSLFYDEVSDVVAAAEFVSRMPDVDASRIYLSGHSAGGTLALLAGMMSPRFRAITSLSGSPDQVFFLQETGAAEWAPFDVTDAREVQIRSPLVYATSLKAPTRIYCGDREVAFAQASRLLAERAVGAGLDVRAQVFPGDHFSAVPAEMRASIAFFETQR